MSIAYSPTLKSNRMQLVIDLIAGKTQAASTGAGSAGVLVIGTSALSGSTGVLATFPLANPAFTLAGAVINLVTTPPLSVAASASGTAALAELRNNAGSPVVSGLTVDVSTGDIQLGTTAIASGGVVSITSGTITHG